MRPLRLAAAALALSHFTALGALAASDVAGRLYQAYLDGESVDQLSLSSEALPSTVSTRLTDLSLEWSALSGLAQRAVLWDGGFVFGNASQLIQVYSPCTLPMTDLLNDVSELQGLNASSADCAIGYCGITNAYLADECATDLVAPLVRCAVDSAAMTETSYTQGVYWAADGQSSDIPNPVLRRHSNGSSSNKYDLYAIHLTSSVFTGSGTCEVHGNFIIPCRARADSDIDFCVPSQSATVDAWLRLLAAPSPKTFSTVSILLIVLLSFFCLLLAVGMWYFYHVGHYRGNEDDDDMLDSMDPLSPTARLLYSIDGETDSSMPAADAFGGGSTRAGDDAISNAELCAKSATLRAFVSDPVILSKRMAFSQLSCLRVLSKGGNGEVWLSQYEARYVAMKCLLPIKRKDVLYLEQFAEEIRLASVLEHPRIVTFCGVAWQALGNLCIVTEYMEKGDLEAVLHQPVATDLTWAQEKLTIALDIAEALVYLHSLVPMVIHRDLKSKNVLLNKNLRAKLSDFGLSRERSLEDTMTNGVGTILWSAPEVLEGKRYDEKADLFSFGIVLSEIDTCLLPYGFNSDHTQYKMKSMQIVHLVAEGKLLPTFREDCPPAIVAIARRCLDLDPIKRPSALEATFMLRQVLSHP